MMREQNFLLLGIFSIVILGGLGLSQDAYAEDSSPVTKNPTNFVQSNNNWSSATTTAADTASDDILCVSATDGNDDISFTGFGFDLPDGATNIFATVNVEVSAQGGASFQLREGTTVLATSGTSPNDSGPTAECSAVESDSVSTGPTAISSVAQAESLNVLVNRGNGNKDVYVNQVSITLTFTEPEPVCGNEIIEAGETCDDGNTTGGDGCSATCQTEEPEPVCGNEMRRMFCYLSDRRTRTSLW